jgi:hypothetical protein
MEIGNRSGNAIAPPPPARAPETAAKGIAPAEVPERKAVTAAADAERAATGDRRDPGATAADVARERAARAPERLRRVRRDEAAGEWVFSTVDAETGAVVNQFPDEAKLRQRAYVESLRRADLDAAEGRRRVTRIA